MNRPVLGPAFQGALVAFATGVVFSFPPEVHPESGLAVALLFAAVAWFGSRLAPGPILVGLLAFAANWAASLAPGRTLETLARLALPLAALLLARELPERERKGTLWVLVGIGAGLGVLALLQRAFLLHQQAVQARALGLPEDMVLRLEQGRPFATHLLPASLAGGLVLALAAIGMLWASRDSGRRWLWVLALPIVAGLVSTSSLGALAGLAFGAVVFVGIPKGRTLRWWLLGAGGLIVILGLAFWLRPVSDMALGQSQHPLTLRAGNWRGAALVALRQPGIGTGLGSFGALYPQVRRPGEIETVYAHNSWLQLAEEGGFPGLLLLGLGAWAFVRRWRQSGMTPTERWALFGVAAFCVHNLVDFTAYLPGVAVPALLLAGFVLGPAPGRAPDVEGDVAAEDRLLPVTPRAWWPQFHNWFERRGGQVLLGIILTAVAVLWGTNMMAIRSLERGEAARQEGRQDEVSIAARRGADWAPWSPAVQLRAGRLLLASDDPGPQNAAAALALADRLRRIDFYSPSGWHLAADSEWVLGRRTVAYTDLALALRRHPADGRIAKKLESWKTAMVEAGLLKAPLGFGGQVPKETDFNWESWDFLLLIFQLMMAAGLLWRWYRPGAFPTSAFALVCVLIAVAWGQGGALPGTTSGRQLLLAVGVLSLIWIRPRPLEEPLTFRIPWGVLGFLLPIGLWAALSAACAPAAASARDGLVAFFGVLVAFLLSWFFGRNDESWPSIAAWVFIASAALAGALFTVQRVATMLGIDLSRADCPLYCDPLRPAGDFLHPGHLGTFLVAAGVCLAALAMGEESLKWQRWFGVGSGTLIVLGLFGAARASSLALAGGGLILTLAAGERRTRRAILVLVGLGLVIGFGFLTWRFSHGDPFAWSRLMIWRSSARAVTEQPILGFGPGGFAPLARRFAFPDPNQMARFGMTFDGPHSDLLGALLAFGIPGGLILFMSLGGILRRVAGGLAQRDESWAARVGILAASTAFLVHGLVDDLFSTRPAVAITAAILLGAAAGRAGFTGPLWAPGRLGRVVLSVGLLTVLLSGELLPTGADFAQRFGKPALAAKLDPRRGPAFMALAEAAEGPPEDRLAEALDNNSRAVAALEGVSKPLEERAHIWSAACFGPLAVQDACAESRAAWSSALDRQPINPFALRARGRLAVVLGDTAAGEQDFRAALIEEPNYIGAALDLVRLLKQQDQNDKAQVELGRLVEQLQRSRGGVPQSPYEASLRSLTPEEQKELKAWLP